MNAKLKTILKVVIFFGIGLTILYLVYARQQQHFQVDCTMKGIPEEDCSLMSKIFQDFKSVNYFWIITTMMLFLVSNILRSLRWKQLFQAIGYKPRMVNLFGTIMINYIANLGIPRSGEIVRAGLISKYENISFEKSLGTIVTDRLFDLIMFAIVITLAILFGGNDLIEYLSENAVLPTGFFRTLFSARVLIPVILILAIIIGLGVKYRSSLVKTRFYQKISETLKGFYTGIESVRYVSNIPLFVVYTIGIWLCYYLMLYLAFFSFEPTTHLGPIAGLVVYAFGSLGILIPTPGGMGSFHYLVGESLGMYGISGADSFSFANIVFFSINIFVNIVFGLAALIILPIVNKNNT